MQVTIETRTVGQNFGTAAVLRNARTGRKVAETEVVPLNFTAAAVERARDMAQRKGWEVVEAAEA